MNRCMECGVQWSTSQASTVALILKLMASGLMIYWRKHPLLLLCQMKLCLPQNANKETTSCWYSL